MLQTQLGFRKTPGELKRTAIPALQSDAVRLHCPDEYQSHCRSHESALPWRSSGSRPLFGEFQNGQMPGPRSTESVASLRRAQPWKVRRWRTTTSGRTTAAWLLKRTGKQKCFGSDSFRDDSLKTISQGRLFPAVTDFARAGPRLNPEIRLPVLRSVKRQQSRVSKWIRPNDRAEHFQGNQQVVSMGNRAIMESLAETRWRPVG